MGRWYGESVSGLRRFGLLFSHHAAKRNRFKKYIYKMSPGGDSLPLVATVTHTANITQRYKSAGMQRHFMWDEKKSSFLFKEIKRKC